MKMTSHLSFCTVGLRWTSCPFHFSAYIVGFFLASIDFILFFKVVTKEFSFHCKLNPPVRCNWSVFARQTHSTSKFDKTSMSKCVCVFVCVSVCIYIYTHMHTYMHACTHTYIPIYLPTYLPIYLPACLHACMHTYTHTHTIKSPPGWFLKPHWGYIPPASQAVKQKIIALHSPPERMRFNAQWKRNLGWNWLMENIGR